MTIFISEKQQISSCFDFSVFTDLIVKMAKDKFGAIQTEYQKVSECFWLPYSIMTGCVT